MKAETSKIGPIVSKAIAAVLGGYAVTYWAGAAFAKSMIRMGVLGKVDAGFASGLVQLVVYTVVVMWVCAATSMTKAWLALASITLLCACYTLLAV